MSVILNVQDIIKKRIKETSLNISSPCIPSTTIAGAGQRCTWYRRYTPTHQISVQCWVNVAAHCWSMPVNCLRRWPKTNLSPGLLYTLRKHVAFNQCCFNVDPQSSSWARILTVQDIIRERTKETSSNISSMCIPSTTIAGAGQHVFNTCRVFLGYTSYRGRRPIYPPNAGSLLGKRRSWFNADQSSTTMAQH